MIILPRLHLVEIADLSWCPSWFREYTQSSLAQMWRTIPPFAKSSPAAQAGDILIENLPHSPSTYTFVDQCAGAGGPSPIVEPRLNEKLRARGEKPAKFVLTDLWPHLREWDAAVKKSDGNLGYVSEPVDATRAVRIAEKGKRECRTFNLCFHHFDDGPAGKVLRSAVETADAFVIFEMTHRTPTALANTTIVVLSPFITTALWFYNSPLHLFFTYLIPLVSILFAIDGYVSCIRTRTPKEMGRLLEREVNAEDGDAPLDLSKWEFKHGERKVLSPFGWLYWYAGIKKE